MAGAPGRRRDPQVDGGAGGGTRRFSLPPGHAVALLDADSLSLVTPLALGVVALVQALPQVLNAFRMGGGAP
jgi:hypothetical protein